ncbi:hypothetical protein X907_1071 [Glycocaulis alkaliphilus]|uniref:Uncharacterized protein n=1 Tax=Glycocaulis alkaliphilus TaxID=1434191 RepID=A0A3T0E8G7_9PROT|nr:hypothetical protein [Glycocaulis alkaliphilus]AZU03609.1 hypothetical protein X907_1071 [Glycocaulis alkaliphilus]GGB82537.1 hypothetical protein GCM10007417_23110 [Glycocaulis alkaliphilus]
MLTATLVLALLANHATSPDDATIDGYVQSGGFDPVDADELADAINAALEGNDAARSALLPAASVDPLTMAVLALQLGEAPLERTRYRITHASVWFDASPGGARSAYSFVEVTRFNLGPAVRRSLEEAYGEDNVAPPEAFGEGPHTAWRLVTRPLRGNRALIVAAGRRTLNEDDAGREQCLGQPCLSADPGIDDLARWSAMAQADTPQNWLQPVPADGPVPPASVAHLIFDAIAEPETDGAVPSVSFVPDPDIEAVIESGLGQDAGVDASYRQHGLLDDSVSAIWERAAVLAGGVVFTATAYECARGPQFAEPGAFCP